MIKMLASSILFLNEFNVVLNLYTIQQQQKRSEYFSFSFLQLLNF